jgi:hypothetical protein
LKSINVHFESRSARDCFRVATTSLELARRANEDWEKLHHSITGITFVAFAIEAMLNHFSIIYFPDWNSTVKRRKDAHKQLFEKANLPNYLGGKEYQLANKCFELRDLLAHGKTTSETVTVDIPLTMDKESILHNVLSIKSLPFREVSYDILELFVENTRKIEKDIEANGYYPNQDHIPENIREHLCECPLSVSGVRTW